MNQEKEKQLIEKYPEIFRDCDKSVQESCMSFGLEVGSGWYDLIDRLCSSLQWDTDKNGYPQVIAQQVKEKYGGLCFYYGTDYPEELKEDYRDGIWNKWQKFIVKVIKFTCPFLRKKFEYGYDRECGTIDGKVRFAQSMSYHICESCGNPGKCNKGGWLSVRCDKCRKD